MNGCVEGREGEEESRRRESVNFSSLLLSAHSFRIWCKLSPVLTVSSLLSPLPLLFLAASVPQCHLDMDGCIMSLRLPPKAQSVGPDESSPSIYLSIRLMQKAPLFFCF